MINIFDKIIQSVYKVISFLLSIIFIKVNLSTSENVTSTEMTEKILNELVDLYKIDFLSRSFEVNENRKIKSGEGFYTCFKDYLYFVKVNYDALMAEAKEDENGNRISLGKHLIVKSVTIYVPFWKFKKIQKTISDVDEQEAPFLYNHMSGMCNGNEDSVITLLSRKNLEKYNQDDIQETFKTLDNCFDEYYANDNYVSLYSDNALDIIEEYALNNDMNIFLFHDPSSTFKGSWSMNERFETFIKRNKGKKCLFYINCNPLSYTYESNYQGTSEFAYRFLLNHMLEYIAVETKFLIILDEKYHARKAPKFESSVAGRYTRSYASLSKIYAKSKKLTVRENNELINKM